MSITARLLKNEGGSDVLEAKSPIELVFQLGAEMDSGTVRYLKTEKEAKGVVAPLAHYNVSVVSPDPNVPFEIYWFVGTDSRALVRTEENGQALYSHEVALVEPSKVLEGVLIDGLGVTQPEAVADRDSLYDVVVRLFSTTPFDYAQETGNYFTLTSNNEVLTALKSVKSPEFKWNTQTTLWECLVQIGAVIDAIPRLVNAANKYIIVTFDFINAYENEVEAIDDATENAVGESVEESQYNSRLRSIVENLLEEE